MRKWVAAFCFCVAVAWVAQAQDNEAARANDLYTAGKQLEALPLYEDLAKTHPDDQLYQERLASCLDAAAIQTNDPAQQKALLTRMRDAARRAVALGDKANVVQDMANFDVDATGALAQGSPGQTMMQEAEKAFSAGDYQIAITKYAAAAEADPHLYVAPLYAGDAALMQRDLPSAARWYAKAIAVDPNRETGYRYWGDAISRLGNDPESAKEKYIAAVIAEPYNKYSWQGLQQWAVQQKAVLSSPKIDLPPDPSVDPKDPNKITINITPDTLNEKKHPGGAAWLGYSMCRAKYRGDQFAKAFPNEKVYRHSLKEEDECLNDALAILGEIKTKIGSLDETLRNLKEVSDAGMLDCWILVNDADDGIAQDYPAYRDAHRQLLHDYLARFVVHGGVSAPQQ